GLAEEPVHQVAGDAGQQQPERHAPQGSTDPAGLILITIYLAEAEGRNVEIRDIAASADIAMSTAERWVKALQAEGMVEAGTDPALGVQLTRLGIEKMEAMLAAVYEVPDAALTVA
ncbi:MAG: hypothetical protein EOO77_44360, partial [Oxalobacteraceae bacterium]